MALVVTGKNRIMIYGPTDDGSYVVEFMTADGDVLSISIPRSEAATSGIAKSGCRTFQHSCDRREG
jgi:hypothetical protein